MLIKQTPEEELEDADAEVVKLIHELELHQIELELQFEESMQLKQELDEVKRKISRIVKPLQPFRFAYG